jgi:hypothetical protein
MVLPEPSIAADSDSALLDAGRLRVEVSLRPFAFTIRRNGRRLLRAGGAWLADGEIRDQFVQFTEGVIAREERSPTQRARHAILMRRTGSGWPTGAPARRRRGPSAAATASACSGRWTRSIPARACSSGAAAGAASTRSGTPGAGTWVAPVLEQGAREREVPLPRGDWIETWSGRVARGGEDVVVPAPIERVPVWVRAGSIVVTYPATHVAAGLGDVPEHERPLEATLWGTPRLGHAAARLADGSRIAWRAGDWELPEGRDVTVATR